MAASITTFIKHRANGPRCGELGWIQLSAWMALDLGLSYSAWLAKVPADVMMAPATMRTQFRKAEKDRNACLIDDGRSEYQTTYGKLST